MKEIPILFSTPMVQAILEGRKTMTRRVVKQPLDNRGVRTTNVPFEDWHGNEIKCPYGQVGDTLWVRETFKWSTAIPTQAIYKADYTEQELKEHPVKWKPCLFMPREACRIFLKITNIRVERLQDISVQDAINEGIENIKEGDPYGFKIYSNGNIQGSTGGTHISFASLWQSINGEQSWNNNPWVWVVEFEKVNRP
jgi:hypothetical protein